MTVTICCEGPSCNAGHSALVREAAILAELPSATEQMRAESERHARHIVSGQLAVTAHERSGVFRRGGIAFATFACSACGHERVYGNSVTFQ